MDIKSPDNVILERPSLSTPLEPSFQLFTMRLSAVVSTIHHAIKFHIENGFGWISSNKKTHVAVTWLPQERVLKISTRKNAEVMTIRWWRDTGIGTFDEVVKNIQVVIMRDESIDIKSATVEKTSLVQLKVSNKEVLIESPLPNHSLIDAFP